MEHCIITTDRFNSIPDPYGKGRICFEITHAILERHNITKILEDENFLYIYNNIVYFKSK